MKFITTLSSYRYEAIAFFTSAGVLTLEIVGARLIAPAFGTSTYVWTATIGVILGALALGYAYGGRLADQAPDGNGGRLLAPLLFVASVAVLLLALVQQPVITAIARLGLDLRLGALFAALVLFGIPSLLIGMVSPHLAKIRVTSLARTGHSIGRLEAASAIGSIAGTFACGYFLLGAFGSRSIVLGVAVLLLATSFLANPRLLRRSRLAALLAIGLAAVVASANPGNVLADVDSSYARYQVLRADYAGVPANLLVTDRQGIQSAAAADGSGGLLLTYTQRYQALAAAYAPPAAGVPAGPLRIMVIGGGTFTLPSALVRSNSDIRVDAVEIDPALTGLARDYFNLADNPRLNIINQDGRTYLNRYATESNSLGRYDIVYMDAFSSLSPPFQLATRQAVAGVRAALTGDGIAVVNVIGTYNGGSGDYLQAIQSTYRTGFRYTAVYQTNPAIDAGLSQRQNFTLLASNDADTFKRLSASFETTNPAGGPQSPLVLRGGGSILTDDYAPLERLTY